MAACLAAVQLLLLLLQPRLQTARSLTARKLAVGMYHPRPVQEVAEVDLYA